MLKVGNFLAGISCYEDDLCSLPLPFAPWSELTHLLKRKRSVVIRGLFYWCLLLTCLFNRNLNIWPTQASTFLFMLNIYMICWVLILAMWRCRRRVISPESQLTEICFWMEGCTNQACLPLHMTLLYCDLKNIIIMTWQSGGDVSHSSAEVVHNPFLPNPFQFIIRLSLYPSTLKSHVADSAK